MPSTILGEYAITLPSGTTAQRPTGAAGLIRHNTTTGLIEYWDTTNSVWAAFQATGGAQANGVIFENSRVITENYTLTTGKNGFSVGPITIGSGFIVNIPVNQRWVVI